IIEWNLDIDKSHNILGIYDKTLVGVVFDELINFGYLYKTNGQFPKIGITTKGIDAILYNQIVLDENSLIQSNLYFKLNNKKVFSKKTSKNDEIKVKVEKIDTYTQSFELYNEGKTLLEISKIRELGLQTIESHMIKLYEFGKINISQIMTFSQIGKLKQIKKIILENDFELDKIQPIKNKLGEEYSYFDIKIALSMIGKKDL
ncbi:MAG: helix-turn-helix domain-containing protein, partial [Candidatus Gracilibacteria bacterium]|nr:helix-turn-helix domain-containing protein [Candidatus Gracilibacteria bacterium]